MLMYSMQTQSYCNNETRDVPRQELPRPIYTSQQLFISRQGRKNSRNVFSLRLHLLKWVKESAQSEFPLSFPNEIVKFTPR